MPSSTLYTSILSADVPAYNIPSSSNVQVVYVLPSAGTYCDITSVSLITLNFPLSLTAATFPLLSASMLTAYVTSSITFFTESPPAMDNTDILPVVPT